MTEELEDYILSHIDEEGEHLARLNRETHIYHLRPRMCSGHLQGRLLKMFVRMINPRNILELGTFTGYSGLCLAEGLIAPDGELHTIEIDDELEDFIRSHFEASAFADRIRYAAYQPPRCGDVPRDLLRRRSRKLGSVQRC